jgi:hypothetical protein
MCAKAGSALAILTSSGDVYFGRPNGKNNNEKLLDYVGLTWKLPAQSFLRVILLG